ncbi:MAG: DUF3461 family protein [Gammaproteobacteria bacterium]|nr:DUF3461 family protein [Gammaproteobacteria bacterium]
MKTYPRLSEMGVVNPEQIAKFSINSINYIDYLRLTYARPKGSLLPVRRTYEFPRVPKKPSGESAKGDAEVVMESNPALRDALQELQEIVGAKAAKHDTVAEMRDELRRLEEEFATRSENLQTLIDKLEKS